MHGFDGCRPSDVEGVLQHPAISGLRSLSSAEVCGCVFDGDTLTQHVSALSGRLERAELDEKPLLTVERNAPAPPPLRSLTLVTTVACVTCARVERRRSARPDRSKLSATALYCLRFEVDRKVGFPLAAATR